MKKAILSILFLLLFPVELSFAQAYPGYVLFAPNNSRYTYLIDGNNQIIHQWTHTRTGGYSCYLLEDGTLMRTANATSSQLNGGGATGIVQKVAWDGTLLWEFTYATATYRSHHDIAPLPNGNVLLIAWETKTAAQAVAMGLNHSASLWPDHVIEVQPVGSNGGNIVWRWNFWDHLIQAFDPNKPNYGTIADHPELLDINTGSSFGDWMHCNGIDYNAALDQIVISSHNLNEIYVIDHSTTTQEAAGHTGGRWGKGGDFLYRWGSPTNYKMNTSNYFKVVHGVNWIKDDHPGGGNILAYNNGFGTNRSEIVELKPDKDSLGNYIWIPGTPFSPATPNWSYSAPGFYSLHLGSCQRMPNGNTFIAESVGGYLFEVDSVGNTVWSYNRGGEIARAMKYPVDYPGLTALPANFVSFTAHAAGTNVELIWETASETNNHHFEILRSHDNISYTPVGTVQGAGTSTVRKEYQFTDKGLTAGKYWYAIRQIDFDGSSATSYSAEVEVLSPHDITIRQNYPNPFNPTTTISYFMPKNGLVKIEVVDITGNLVSVLVDEMVNAGENSVIFDAGELSSGVYFYRVTAGGFVKVMPMVLAK